MLLSEHVRTLNADNYVQCHGFIAKPARIIQWVRDVVDPEVEIRNRQAVDADGYVWLQPVPDGSMIKIPRATRGYYANNADGSHFIAGEPSNLSIFMHGGIVQEAEVQRGEVTSTVSASGTTFRRKA